MRVSIESPDFMQRACHVPAREGCITKLLMILFGSDCRYRCDPRGDFLIMPSSSNCIRPSRFSGFAPVLVGCVLLAGTFSQARTASELFKDRQYGDVIKVLTDEIKNKPDADGALELRSIP